MLHMAHKFPSSTRFDLISNQNSNFTFNITVIYFTYLFLKCMDILCVSSIKLKFYFKSFFFSTFL